MGWSANVGKKKTTDEKIQQIKDTQKVWDVILQPFENVVDTVWQGETDKDKKKRLEKEAKDAAEQAKKSEEMKQKVFDILLYTGMGMVVFVTVILVIR
jgi:hypothetical protein